VAKRKEPEEGESLKPPEADPEEDREAIGQTGMCSVEAGFGPEDKGMVVHQPVTRSNPRTDRLAKGEAREPTAVQETQKTPLLV
jgi:hypothetical protein